jgi:hypothetical protein
MADIMSNSMEADIDRVLDEPKGEKARLRWTEKYLDPEAEFFGHYYDYDSSSPY